MPSIYIDVDLDEFSTDDLIEELICRMRKHSPGYRKGFSEEQKEKIKKAALREFSDLPDLIGNADNPVFPVKTLDDKMKLDHLAIVFSKYSVAEILQKLPD